MTAFILVKSALGIKVKQLCQLDTAFELSTADSQVEGIFKMVLIPAELPPYRAYTTDVDGRS